MADTLPHTTYLPSAECTPRDSGWAFVSWNFIAIIMWLLYLLMADTKEREKIGQQSHQPINLAFRTRSLLWLISLVLSSMGAWNIWKRSGWSDARAYLVVYFVALFFTILTWRQYWVVRRFILANIASNIASLLILATLTSFATESVESAVLVLPYMLVQVFESINIWLFYKANRSTEFGNRDTGRFQDPHDRINANEWVLSQNPNLHVIPSNFQIQIQPTTLGETTRSNLAW